MKGPTEKFEASLYDKGTLSRVLEPVVTEAPVEIFFNDLKVATIACTGIHLEELALGFLLYSGQIRTLEEVKNITLSAEDSRVNVLTSYSISPDSHSPEHFVLSSGARGRGCKKKRQAIKSDTCISANRAIAFMEELLSSSQLHSMTHGTHCSALADRDHMIVMRDDIGRHNTIDMLAGYALLGGIDCSDKIIVKTGRVSSEIAEKVWTLGIPIMISHSVPTSEAINILNKAGITLIGNVRGKTFKVYTHERRVQV